MFEVFFFFFLDMHASVWSLGIAHDQQLLTTAIAESDVIMFGHDPLHSRCNLAAPKRIELKKERVHVELTISLV